MEETSCSISRAAISLTYPEQRKMFFIAFAGCTREGSKLRTWFYSQLCYCPVEETLGRLFHQGTSLHFTQLQSGGDACAGSRVTVYPRCLQTQQRQAAHPPSWVKDLEGFTSHPIFPSTADFQTPSAPWVSLRHDLASLHHSVAKLQVLLKLRFPAQWSEVKLLFVKSNGIFPFFPLKFKGVRGKPIKSTKSKFKQKISVPKEN